LHRQSKEVFLVARISITNNNDYNFISLNKENTLNIVDEYNDFLLKSIDTSKLSEHELKIKLYDLINSYKETTNDNSFLVIEG
jgi:hypothetical protein